MAAKISFKKFTWATLFPPPHLTSVTRS
uniref:Uncharacterized protein n=1 Tax=Anguilla anguilla TaxID=7936 RepID=A0A0E9RXT7_ANGAN